ncbi:uncharacterized protein [Centruroides vittatus]|uniref:uncharacterized protein isoform X2 n=1 Tax=Centruroides vittatus TaxID=120091 RepID=UPI00350F2D09
MFSTVFYLLIAWRLSLQSHAEDKDLQVHGDVLHCPPCRKLHCWPKLHRLKCKGGITLGVCNCCPVCAKVAGESCGGQWNYLGKCDRSLYCQPQKATLYSYVVEDTKKVFSIGRGICKPATTPRKFKNAKEVVNILRVGHVVIWNENTAALSARVTISDACRNLENVPNRNSAPGKSFLAREIERKKKQNRNFNAKLPSV